jgi:hypothetical protein
MGMFDSDRPDVYEKVYLELLGRLAKSDLLSAAKTMNLDWDGRAAKVPCLGRDYLVGPAGVEALDGGKALITHRIVLAWYLLHQGRGENTGRFVPYRELPGGQDFARSLSAMVEGRLAQNFSGKVHQLAAASQALGAAPADIQTQPDLAFVVEALPKIPLMLTFYDADEEFPAEAKLFYDLTAPNFLDMECLAVLGQILVMDLELKAKGQKAAPA